jgi:hypothetical protein
MDNFDIVKGWVTGSVPCIIDHEGSKDAPTHRRDDGIFWAIHLTTQTQQAVAPSCELPTLASCNVFNRALLYAKITLRATLCVLSEQPAVNLFRQKAIR